MDWGTIGKWIAGLVVAATAAGIAIKFVFVRKNTNGNSTTTQNNNRAGRDIIGGDKIDKR